MRYEEFLARHPPTAFDPDKEFPPPKWLIENLWLAGGKINGVFGTPKSGKSRLLNWLLANILAREDPISLRLGEVVPHRILYMRAEESEQDISRRLAGYGKKLGADVSGWGKRLSFMPAMDMMLERLQQRRNLEQYIRDEGVDLMVIDPYVRVHGAEENDATAMAQIHNELRRWTDQYGMDLILVHHTGKVDDSLPLDTDISRWARGTSDIAAILDTGVLLHRYSTESKVKMYRSGRFPPQGRIVLQDLGDEHGWKFEKKI